MSAAVAPRAARKPAVRLKSIAASASAPSIVYQSAATRLKGLPQQGQKKQAPLIQCCEAPNISFDDGSTICYNCGHVHQESAIVSEVTFGETAGGAAMVEGGFIGENQRHANSMGGTMRGLGGMASSAGISSL
jgi:transcription factor IIIB subunit 2